jgi:hypothetical protein
VWDGQRTLFEFNYLALGIPAEECFIHIVEPFLIGNGRWWSSSSGCTIARSRSIPTQYSVQKRNGREDLPSKSGRLLTR